MRDLCNLTLFHFDPNSMGLNTCFKFNYLTSLGLTQTVRWTYQEFMINTIPSQSKFGNKNADIALLMQFYRLH